MSFARPLPFSVRPVVGLRATVCSQASQPSGSAAESGYYVGYTHAPNFGLAARLEPGCTLVGGSAAPRGAVFDGAVHVYVATAAATTTPWQVDTVTITGTQYVLR